MRSAEEWALTVRLRMGGHGEVVTLSEIEYVIGLAMAEARAAGVAEGEERARAPGERLARAVLLFYSPGPWGLQRNLEWDRLTGCRPATTRTIGDMCRALAAPPPEPKPMGPCFCTCAVHGDRGCSCACPEHPPEPKPGEEGT
jgi:hypothetical protein